MMQNNNYSIPFDSIDDLFSIPKEAEGHTVILAPLKDLFPYSNHPFRVIDDEKMDELFGGMFDFNNDGMTDNIELALGFQIMSGMDEDPEED